MSDNAAGTNARLNLAHAKIETQAVHAGRKIDPATGAVTLPIHLSTTFERAPDGAYPLGFSYAREGNPTRQSLEECLAAIEGGREALAFSSGMAVAAALLQGLEPGDHIIAPEDVYYGLRQLIGGVFAKWPLETTYVDMTDAAAVRAAVRPSTRLVVIETPSNPLMRITDLAAVARIARTANAISVCDGTFTTPILQRPLDLGIDMVWHSTTKYIGGHSDMLGGALITRYGNYLFERARKSLMFAGAAPSAFDCWLALRGASTLPWRMRAHCANALAVAEFLQQHPAVELVHYPGLPAHPGHDIAKQQMSGWGGMLSFQVRGGRDAAMAVAARLQLFTRATSLGGPHSLIEHRASIEGRDTKTPQNLLRASIGLENAGDLIADLQQALSA
ncbi:MAG TPA: aminotransferase class I/II-fold pyridoxal phosphate-dependent enzyme [Bryobacteraceae bacterium]|nr:aminotransferase class I/II-fold pyridoxal phosphate-dependent enzyme [Bryobacteraceae bacterium]